MRKEYTKPAVTRVNLVPGEAVLGACKTNQFWLGPSGSIWPWNPIKDTCRAGASWNCKEAGS
jgi:hypothetical protein